MVAGGEMLSKVGAALIAMIDEQQAAVSVPTRAEIMSALVCEWAFDQLGRCDAEAEGACEPCKMRWKLQKLDGFELQRAGNVTDRRPEAPVEAPKGVVRRRRMTARKGDV